MNTASITPQNEDRGPVCEIPEHLIPMCLGQLGWIAVTLNSSEVRWIDPNSPDSTPNTTTYAWYVSQMRVKNRSDTKFHRFTNGDLADLVEMRERRG
ncbi:hypothetical protein QTV43_000090 [Vibrio vulnificus]|nr:hypothetical protein [Vibrio vulnificus]